MLRKQPHNFRLVNHCWMGASGVTQNSFQELLGTSGASHADDYRPHIRLGYQLERQEGATLPFCHNHLRYNRNPLGVPGNAESISIREFLGLDHGRPKLGEERRIALAKFCARQTARYRHVIGAVLQGRLAGGTTPFMRKYSTICP